MGYNSIFDIKPSKDNKKAFCKRIAELLNSIGFYENGCYYNNGKKMLNVLFRYNKHNKGYFSIEDLLHEANYRYVDIFDLQDKANISEEEILVNVDIIANCFIGFKETGDLCFYPEEQSKDTIMLIMEAINNYLLSLGYKLMYDEDNERMNILQNEIAVEISEIKNKELQSEIINYYDYKNANNIKEKKKILLGIIGELEPKKKQISELLGKDIANMLGNYANNFNIRHENTDSKYKSQYREGIAKLDTEELIKWYDYIFAFAINIYISIDDVKNVNINSNFKDTQEV